MLGLLIGDRPLPWDAIFAPFSELGGVENRQQAN